MNVEDFVSAQKKIISIFREKIGEFESIKNSKNALIFRWQDFIGIVLSVQIQVIQEYGYSGDQTGLSEFNEQLMRLSLNSQTLQNLNEEKWSFLFEKAFGLTEYRKISHHDAQKLINDIANAMAQRALIDYYFESVILEKSKSAQKIIFERANLL